MARFRSASVTWALKILHRLQHAWSLPRNILERKVKGKPPPHLARTIITLDPPFPRSPRYSSRLGRANNGSESIVLISGLQLLHGSAHPLRRLGILRRSSRKKKKNKEAIFISPMASSIGLSRDQLTKGGTFGTALGGVGGGG